MKNLSAIPRLSFLAVFTILITLVVSLAGFTVAEVNINRYKENQNRAPNDKDLSRQLSFKDNSPYSPGKLKLKDDEKSFSDYIEDRSFNDFEGSDKEEETDGYGYDDDDYYHFNSKRNDDDRATSYKGSIEELNKQDLDLKALNSKKYMTNKNDKEDKESETIEMLSYNESHISDQPHSQSQIKKQFVPDSSNKKVPSSGSKDSVKLCDIKKNSAVEEKVESEGEDPSKDSDEKKEGKVEDEEKEGLKETKTEDSEKKDKDINLKDEKEDLDNKEDGKASVEKEKVVNVNENPKVDESANEKHNEETVKVTKDKDSFSGKAGDLSQNRASFVGSDYKDGFIKTSAEDKSLEMDLRGDFQNNIDNNDNFMQDSRYLNQIGRENDYITFPIAVEINPEDNFKKRESWNDPYQQSHRLQLTYERPSYRMSLPNNEFENTEYHKNYLKSLKRYKNLEDGQKILSPDSLEYRRFPQTRFDEKFTKEKRSKSDGCHARRNAVDESSFENNKNRKRRKSPNKLEYEIKIINQNDQNTKNVPMTGYYRRKKDLKSKVSDRGDSRYSKKSPYSQVSRDDLIKVNKLQWMDDSFGSSRSLKAREVPSGYYSNRVKFGQKQAAPSNEKSNGMTVNINQIPSSQGSIETNRVLSPNENNAMSVGSDKFVFQQLWDAKSPDNLHDPMKRYDEFTNKNIMGGSLLLVKKDRNGDRVAKTFIDGTSKGAQEEEMDPDQLAKILSRDGNYVVLKKTDKNKYQKVLNDDMPGNRYEYGSKKSDLFDFKKYGNLENKHVSRSYTLSAFNGKDTEAKYHNAGPMTGLKKTFEKFKDLADFFRDSEPDSSENHHPEVKEGSDIVFSEDRLPDPIIINNDENEKSMAMKEKALNSMSSISNNFKQSDQAGKGCAPKEDDFDKDRLITNTKQGVSESNWEPALKKAFPEAKTVNSVRKNGNEIILLDFDRNQMKTEEGSRNILPSGSKTEPGSPVTISGDRQVEIVLSENAIPPVSQSLNIPDGRKYQTDKENPLLKKEYGNDLQILPQRTLTKKSVNGPSNLSPNFNQFLKDFREYSEINKQSYDPSKLRKRNLDVNTVPSSSFPEMSSYSNANVKYLGNLLQNIMTNQKDENSGVYGNQGYQKPGSYDHYLKHQGLNDERTKDYLEGFDPESMFSEDEARDDYQDTLWKDLSAASNTIQRLRREGMDKGELRKAIEDALVSSNEKNLKSNLNGNKGSKLDPAQRKKRSDLKNKLSRTENTFLRMESGNESSYFPGSRKLLSIEEQVDKAERYLNDKEGQQLYTKNEADKCVDPPILEIFGKKGNSRIRRSLTGPYHTDYKREIDLDESMPNDFQSFLMTSLGGFGSQKVVKKEEALWDRKESSPDNYNQIAESSTGDKETNGDSGLEKREVPNDKKRENYFKSPGNDAKALQKVRSQDESLSKSKTEFEEEKVPTQIRIQITNASSKRKKSSKPIMDGSNEMETIPKEKDFFEKSKLNSIRINNPQKLHQIPKSKYSYVSDFGNEKNVDNADRQRFYVASRPYRRGKRKKKKYESERSLKTLNDFSPVDQKAMENLIRKYLAGQNTYGMTKKMPVSNHLPQVETVYNPTQGTDKAQLERYQFNKMLNKNTESAKNGLQGNVALRFDEEVMKNYMKEKSAKSKAEKVYSKKYDDGVELQPYAAKGRATQNLARDSEEVKLKNYKSLGVSSNRYYEPSLQTYQKQDGLTSRDRSPYFPESLSKLNEQTYSDDSWSSNNYLNPIEKQSYLNKVPVKQSYNFDSNLEYVDSNEDYEDPKEEETVVLNAKPGYFNPNEAEEEEDYDENAEEDWDDYSLLAGNPEGEKLSYYQADYPIRSYNEEKFEPLRHETALTDVKTDADALGGSFGVLKQANQNADILRNNLLKAYERYNQGNRQKMTQNWQEKLKLKRSREYPIGSRLFYAAKTDAADTKNLSPEISGRHSYYDMQRNPLKAALREAENEFEMESGEDHFEGDLINPGKDQSEDGSASKRNSEEVKDSIEDDGETISEDNVLENVIGKYIMRKRVNPRFKKENSPAEPHKKQKRSLEMQTKVAKKRLTSGHLTENNFKKFHKKNLNRKRNAKGLEEMLPNADDHKRSALDLLKRLTSKDKDNKKVESFDVRTAGFEPILSSGERNYQTYMKDIDDKPLSHNKPPLVSNKNDRLELLNTLEESGGKQKDKVREEYAGQSVSKVEGPWKVELNEQNEISVPSKNDRKYPVSGDSQDLKAYLIISKDVKRTLEEPFTGSPNRIWKRSSGSGQTGAQLPPKANGLFYPKQNRALHDSPSTRHAENASFVSAIGQPYHDNPPPKGRSSKRKSSFPPSSAANIIKDSSQLNEESSKYLGQQIVEAILAQASSNPRFKKVIAPGLVLSTPWYNEESDDIKRRELHKIKFSDQVQSLLKNVMFEVEKLAEKHVKRRMCNRIDKQSKQFLHSLLNVRMGNNRDVKMFDSVKEDCLDDSCSKQETSTGSSSVSSFVRPLPMTYTAPHLSQEVYKNLKNKQSILLKLMDDYLHLSKIEKDTLEVNFKYLARELAETNKAIEMFSHNSTSKPDQEAIAKNPINVTEQPVSNPSENVNPSEIKPPETTESPNTENYMSFDLETQEASCDKSSTQLPITLIFEPAKKPDANDTDQSRSTTTKPPQSADKSDSNCDQCGINTSYCTSTTTSGPFEKVLKCDSDNKTNERVETKTFKTLEGLESSTPLATPQSFDLLAGATTGKPANATEAPKKCGANVRVKQSPKDVWEGGRRKMAFSDFFRASGMHPPSELQRLGRGDAAGLHVFSKHQRPWVSSLDAAKGTRSFKKPRVLGGRRVSGDRTSKFRRGSFISKYSPGSDVIEKPHNVNFRQKSGFRNEKSKRYSSHKNL